MSERALFKNAFQQIRRLWKSAVNLEERVITLEHRIYDDDDGIVRRVNALEDVAHTPSEAECKRQEAEIPNIIPNALNPRGFNIQMRTVDELVDGGPMWAGVFTGAEVVAELERRILQARERGYEDRFGVARPEAAKPEPEPTKHYSFREAAKIIQDNHWIDMGEPRSDTLYVLVQTRTTNSETDSIDVHWHHEQATKEQVRAEAVRLGLLKE